MNTPFPSSVSVGGIEKGALLQALRAHDVQLNPAAEALFGDSRFALLPQPQVISIAVLSVQDLGLENGATYEQLMNRAVEQGLAECPLELGPQMRLQFLNQGEAPTGSSASRHRAPAGSITVASAPLDDRDETPKGFYLRRAEGVLWLRGYWSGPDHVWSPEDTLVFARRSASTVIAAS